MIFEPMIDWNSRHPDIHTRLQRIAFRIEPQDRRMLSDSVFEQDHVHIVMKVLFLPTRWLCPFHFRRQQKRGYVWSASVPEQKSHRSGKNDGDLRY